MRNLKAIDLFCGAGGLSLGLQAAGFDILFAADSWKVATRAYSLNFSHPILTVDLASTPASSLWRSAGRTSTEVDVVVGGPPCQGFSVQRIGPDLDHRNHMVLEFARLVSEIRPRMFLMENVPGLLGKRGRTLATAFEEQMDAAGYLVNAFSVNAAAYGVPQIRKRVMYVGTLRNALSTFRFPGPSHVSGDFRTVADAIGDLPSPPVDLTPTPTDRLHRRTRLSELNQKRINLVPPGGGMMDLPPELRVDCHKAGADRIGHRFVYGRMAPGEPAPTITARFDSFTRGKFGHPWEHRNITLREGARLQTFPDSFRFEGSQEEIAALIGNAVPPLLAEVVLRAVSDHLTGRGPSVAVRQPAGCSGIGSPKGHQSLFCKEDCRRA